MLPPKIFHSIEKAVSPERMDNHRNGTEADEDTLARYVWNMALSEAMYPALQNLEVAFRNALHFAATNEFGTNYWFDSSVGLLRPQDAPRIADAKDILVRQSKPLTSGHVVAELSFGFWISLLNRRYEGILWPRLLNSAFPYVPRTLKHRHRLLNHLNPLRDLRNKVFHHRAIWRMTDLSALHQNTIEAIGWINPELKKLTIAVDRFPQVFAQGSQHYKGLAQSIR